MHRHDHTDHAHDHTHDHGHAHDHAYGHDDGGAPGHTHGTIDPSILTTERGIWALKWSCIGLLLTALVQVVVVWLSGSVGLLADTIHNFGDAATAIPLWFAFRLERRKPSQRFTYGYGRMEDVAGIAIVLTILASALVAGYESVDRLLHPQPVGRVGAVIFAALVGFLGNEGVAVFRIKVGQEMGSAALVADGYHARVDGVASLAVLCGALGVWMGYPLADPLVGMLITLVIFKVVWDAGQAVFSRLLDGVDPQMTAATRQAASETARVEEVTEVRVRWLGHRLHAELHVAVDPRLAVADGHGVAVAVERRLLERVRYLADATIHVDPVDASGPAHHRAPAHAPDESSHRHLSARCRASKG